jgi:ribosomal protein L37AE/L43A
MALKVWICPNAKCPNDKELQPGQSCSMCGEQAKEFSLSDTDGLLKQKWDFKKSINKAKRQERLMARIKFCPKCGSSNINFLVFYRPSIWKCLDCGYEGALILEDGKLAEKLQKQYRRTRKAAQR